MAEAKTQPSQEFEKVLKDSATEVASFERHDKPLIERIQHVLHSNPALVPLIVLVLSVAIFGAVLGSKFFSPFALTLILQQVAIVGIVGSAQTLVVLTAGIDLSVGAIMVLSSVVMGQFTFRYGLPAPISILCGFAVGGLIGYVNGYPGREDQAAALHRHARHVADRARDELPLLAQRDDPQPGHRRSGAAAEALRLDRCRLADARASSSWSCWCWCCTTS